MSETEKSSSETEKRFHEEMVDIFRKAKEIDIVLPRYITMVRKRGGVAAAKRLIRMKTTGFSVLSLVDYRLTVEMLVLNPEFESLFSEEERDICDQKLKKVANATDKVRSSSAPLYMGRHFV